MIEAVLLYGEANRSISFAITQIGHLISAGSVHCGQAIWEHGKPYLQYASFRKQNDQDRDPKAGLSPEVPACNLAKNGRCAVAASDSKNW